MYIWLSFWFIITSFPFFALVLCLSPLYVTELHKTSVATCLFIQTKGWPCVHGYFSDRSSHLLIDWLGDVVHLECTGFCWLFHSTRPRYIPSSNLSNLIINVRHGGSSGVRSSLVPHFLHFRLRLAVDWVCRPIGTSWPFHLVCRNVVDL
jgi:hypothetical protein